MYNNESNDSTFKVKKNKKTDRGNESKNKFPSSTDLSFENSAGIINDNEYEVKSEYDKEENNIYKKRSQS